MITDDLRSDLVRAMREHGAKRVAFEAGVRRETVSRWVNGHNEPCPVHRRVLVESLLRLGVTGATTAQGSGRR